MTGTTQNILTWARTYIPDRKSDTLHLKDDYLGDTSAPVDRETFYLNHRAVGTVTLYVKPYQYSSTASLGSATSTDKVFMYNATLQTCILPSTSDSSIRPSQYQKVKATYSYNQDFPYAYTDTELAGWLPLSMSYLNNVHNLSYTYTGSGDSIVTSVDNDSDIEFIARSLAIIVRRQFVEEQKQRGLGIRFRGPMAVIDSVQQMKSFEAATNKMEADLAMYADRARANSTGGGIDIYDETVVTD